jgi:hypothetical protein
MMPPIRRTGSPPPLQKRKPPTDDEDDDDEDLLEERREEADDLDIDLDDDPMNTFGQDPNYNQAVAKGQYIRVHFIKPLRNHITASTLMPDTKSTLIIISEGLFDKTQVLARRKNLKLAEIGMEIIIAQARIGFHPSDVDNPDLANIVNMIKDMYVAFISRSENGWERELDNRMETSHTNRIVDDRFRQQQQQKSNYPVWHPKRWI